MKLKLLTPVLLIAFTACQQNSKSNQSSNTTLSISDSLLTKIDSYLNSYVGSGFSEGILPFSRLKLSGSEWSLTKEF